MVIYKLIVGLVRSVTVYDGVQVEVAKQGIRFIV